MGIQNALFSFLKKEKINYIFVPEKNVVKLPCFRCHSESLMCTLTTDWNCPHCGENGTLFSYIKFLQDNDISLKMYNPINEKRNINNILNRLIHNNQLSNNTKISITNLKTKVDRLVNYYEDNHN